MEWFCYFSSNGKKETKQSTASAEYVVLHINLSKVLSFSSNENQCNLKRGNRKIDIFNFSIWFLEDDSLKHWNHCLHCYYDQNERTNLISERVCVNWIFCCQQRWWNHDAHKDDVSKMTVVAEPVTEHPDTENHQLVAKYQSN